MSYILNSHQKNLLKIIRDFDVIPEILAIELIKGMDDTLNDGEAELFIRNLLSRKIISEDKYMNLKSIEIGNMLPSESETAALWVFTRYIKEAGGSFSKARYPGVIMWKSGLVLKRIIVIEDRTFPELRMLKEMESTEDVMDIIVSPWIGPEEIDDSLWPDKAFTFIKLSGSGIKGKPEFEIYEADAKR